jgi:adenylate cyclase class 2
VGKPEENEVKIAAASAPKVLALLRRTGFRVIKPRIFENNIVLDDAQSMLRKRGLLLRVRDAGKTITCTFKGKQIAGLHKRREEREFHADDLTACVALFKGIGFEPAFRYEKYRTEFAREGEPGHITLDETPIGVFIELEGPARWLDRTAKELGHSRDDYITASYGALYIQWRAAHKSAPADMRF